MSGIEFDATGLPLYFHFMSGGALGKYFQNGSAVLVAMDEYIVLWCCFCFVFVIVFFSPIATTTLRSFLSSTRVWFIFWD